MSHAYLVTPFPRTEIEIFEAEDVPTAVLRRDNFPMNQMRTLFDQGVAAMFPALAQRSIQPIGPAFSLHYRVPTDTTDLEVGFPLSAPMTEEIDAGKDFVVEPSVLPGGRIASISHVGPYAGLGPAWGAFMNRLAADGHQIGLPFWEVYFTEPSPDIDPATIRTDLYARLA